METFLIRALQLIMSLSLLVIIHEGGHFLFASSSNQRKAKQNMLSGGCRWVAMSR